MSSRTVLDVSGLPTYAYGNRGLMWWGTWGLIFIEGIVFAAAIVA
jgi:cytochrome c oxidase subunit III